MPEAADILQEEERAACELVAAQLVAPFRGGAVENLGDAPMGKGHGNHGRPFDLNTACYLKPVFAEYERAIRTCTRRKLVLKAGVKTMKSFFGEVCAGDHVCNRRGDVAIFFGTESTAEAGATTRILDFYRGNDQGGGIPRFREKMLTIESRFDETMGALKFPDKTLFILAANMSNTQQKNLAFVLLQDAFLTESSGMIKEMIARTTQYEKEAIIILESQGGEKEYDFDTEYEDTDQRELHVLCPCCGSSHIFNWKAYDADHMTRVESSFVPKPPLNIPSLDHAAWVAHHRPLLLKPERRVAGFKRGPEELIHRSNGEYDEQAILRETYFECFHCGGAWRDDGEFGATRIALDESSHFVAARPDALWYNVGFNIPQWINRRLSWGGMMLDKLKAHRVAERLGNYNYLKKWWQKVAARTWDNNMTAKAPEIMAAQLYDTTEKIPGELCRASSCDFQLNGTHLIYQSWALGNGVPPRLLHYEWIKPPAGLDGDQAKREWCKNRARDLNKRFGIEQQNFLVDANHRPDLVREWAADDAVQAWMKVNGKLQQKWVHYGLLIGDDRVSYRWAHPGRKPTWERFKQKETVLVDAVRDGKNVRIPIQHRLWSNPSIKEIAERWRDGDNAPKIEVHADFLKDSSWEGFWAQMNSERKVPWKGRPGRMRYDNEGRPNHAWDGFCMIMVRMDELLLLNHFGPPEADEEASGRQAITAAV